MLPIVSVTNGLLVGPKIQQCPNWLFASKFTGKLHFADGVTLAKFGGCFEITSVMVSATF